MISTSTETAGKFTGHNEFAWSSFSSQQGFANSSGGCIGGNRSPLPPSCPASCRLCVGFLTLF